MMTEMVELYVKKLSPNAILPSYAHEGDAGLDLYALERVVLAPGEKVAVATGISIALPKGMVGLIWDKSGLAITHGLKTLGGVIDAIYRGEVRVGMVNVSTTSYTIEAGHKVAQLIIQKYEEAQVREVATLDETSRGVYGFGSTGK